jgi:hypothetical protein
MGARVVAVACLTWCLAACGSVPVGTAARANVIPWIDALPAMPTPTPRPVIPAGTLGCSIGDLGLSYDGAGGLGGGQLSATVGFVNVGSNSCVLQGFPGQRYSTPAAA